MSDQLPARIERKRVWEVDASGIAVEQQQKKTAPPTTSGQRHYFYRLGLMAVAKFLQERGFRSMSESQSTLMYELRQQIWIDIGIKNPANIAYVTSRPGYEYNPNKVTAQITTAKDILGCSKVIQIVVSTRLGTHQPVYIPLPKDLENPAKHVLTQVLSTLNLLCDKIPGMREGFSKVDPNSVSVPDTLIDENFLRLLEE